jgi:hypothetical protein
VLSLIGQLHSSEFKNNTLQCVSKGVFSNYTEYHVMWGSNGMQYRSFIRVPVSGSPVETLFGEV